MGRTPVQFSTNANEGISTHSPRAGRTASLSAACTPVHNFNSLAPCGANHINSAPFERIDDISTHSPRVGRTFGVYSVIYCYCHFNSLAPCGANQMSMIIAFTISAFQLTRPVWGEPVKRFEERLATSTISTHSPRVGRTIDALIKTGEKENFNSLAPCGANLAHCLSDGETALISTHSPRVGRTQNLAKTVRHAENFNSLAPCGANLVQNGSRQTRVPFQLTRPVWGEPRYILRADK